MIYDRLASKAMFNKLKKKGRWKDKNLNIFGRKKGF